MHKSQEHAHKLEQDCETRTTRYSVSTKGGDRCVRGRKRGAASPAHNLGLAAFLEMRLLEDRMSCRKNGAVSVVRAGTDGVPQAWGRQAPHSRAPNRCIKKVGRVLINVSVELD